VQPEGSPPPSLQWYRNGLMLPHERKNILVATEVNRSHEGTYSCRLTNMAGTFTWLEATVEIRAIATSVPRLPSSASPPPPPPRGANPPTTTVSVPAVPSHHQQKQKEQQREGL
jgi:hypothetical protein